MPLALIGLPFETVALQVPIEYDIRFTTPTRWFVGLQLSFGYHTRYKTDCKAPCSF